MGDYARCNPGQVCFFMQKARLQMSTYRRWSQAVSAAFLLVFIITAWIVFAPLQMGGQAAYVIVTGNSMEPGFHLGDLVIVRQASVYQVGDIVTYRNAELRSYVFHRIIALELGRFILKGDNNTWIDSYRPTQEELVGKLWIQLPGIGKAVQWLRLRTNVALMAAALGGIVMADVLTKQPKYKKKKKASNQTGFIEGLFFGLGLLAFVSFLLGIFAFTRPLWRTVDEVPYQHMGIFSYSATAPSGVYDTEMVQTGDPIFPKLTCSINLGFLYNLVGYQLQDLIGSHQLIAQVTDDQSGWHRTILLEPETAFSGNSFTTSATLDLCQVETIVEAVEQETGFHPSNYKLFIISHVTILGKVAGRDLFDTFEPRLEFNFDKLHFYLVKGDTQDDPSIAVKAGLLKDSRMEANTVSILGLEPTISAIRAFALIGLGISLGGMLILGIYVYNVSRRSQESLVRIKYRAMLVDVHTNGLETRSPVIDVTTIDELAKLAERQNSMILHDVRGLIHYYLVQTDNITYRYILREGRVDDVGKKEPQSKYLNR